MQISKRERKLFDKPFRHYYALKGIYGKDRASGNAYNNVKTQEEILGTNLGTTLKIEPRVEGHNIPFDQQQTLRRRNMAGLTERNLIDRRYGKPVLVDGPGF